ncbi:transporter [Wenyingzhuangia aestuarii]|uniref:transporter n=1 Tax=Wenyingzhuangia aestuarii TaxID=1647582 RepID=UPI00143B739F|nr:transporter [Wenyingzhuangia aestuarii]NJB82585.1 hypothetical protein [Wenyingzhuangia aestuarii]
MNRFLLSFFCFFLYTATNYAQYTNIINSNKPGHTETPYALGTNVLQFENTVLYNSLDSQHIESNSYSNNFNMRYGFWKEKLEASLDHIFTTQNFNATNSNITGTEILSVGLKYLIYQHIQKESPAVKKSWKRRYGFKYNGLIPSIAAKLQINTPLTNLNFSNGGSTTLSTSIIAQNHINQKVRINNQFDYKYIGGDMPEFIYTLSSSYVMAKRFNPYLEARYHNLKDFNYFNIGVGTPFLVNRDFSVAVHYNLATGKNTRGSEFGINASYRIDNHYDRWEYIDVKKEEEPKPIIRKKVEKKEEEFVDEILLDEKNKTKEEILNEYFRQQDEALRKQEEKDRKEEEERLKREEKERKKKEKERKRSKKRKVKKKEMDDVILSY